jgi:hypothetical protein
MHLHSQHCSVLRRRPAKLASVHWRASGCASHGLPMIAEVSDDGHQRPSGYRPDLDAAIKGIEEGNLSSASCSGGLEGLPGKDSQAPYDCISNPAPWWHQITVPAPSPKECPDPPPCNMLGPLGRARGSAAGGARQLRGHFSAG